MRKQDEHTYVNRDIGDHDKLHDLWDLKLGAKNQLFDVVWVELVTYKYFRRAVGEEGLPGTKVVTAVHTEGLEEGGPLDRKAAPPR